MESLPEVARSLMDRWHQEAINTPVLALADERAVFRHSNATACSRRLFYEQNFPDERVHADVAGHWVMRLGTEIHKLWQDAAQELLEKQPGITVEAETHCFIERCRSAGHVDLVATGPDGRVVFELKTINGTGFRQVTRENSPRYSAQVQGALNAYALDADRLVIVYLAMEAMSPTTAHKSGFLDPISRVMATFSYSRTEYMPSAWLEIERWASLLPAIESGVAPSRVYNDDGTLRVITGPSDGSCADGKKVWVCNYCPFQQKCLGDLLEEEREIYER